MALAGAKTNDIIAIYVNSIKILRQVDPTGVLLEAVSGPTRGYLQGRKDTIRSIVTAMTDGKSEVAGESLYEELQRPAQQVSAAPYTALGHHLSTRAPLPMAILGSPGPAAVLPALRGLLYKALSAHFPSSYKGNERVHASS